MPPRQITIREIPECERIQDLAGEIEAFAQHPVLFLEYDEKPEHLAGAQAACDTDSGYPIVYFSPGSVTAINACHELLHLKCEYLGYPRPCRTFEVTPDLTIEQWAVHDGITEISSFVEHRVIYPQMEELGFDPYADVARVVMKQGFFESLAEMRKLAQLGAINASGHMNLMTQSARFLLEVRDAGLRKRLLQEKEWFAEDFRKASKIARILSRAGLTPYSCRRAMVQAFDVAEIPKDTYDITMGTTQIEND